VHPELDLVVDDCGARVEREKMKKEARGREWAKDEKSIE